MSIRFDVITLFPGIFSSFLGEGLLHKARMRGLIDVHCWDLRDWSQDKHQKVDDRPYGGGAGMVIMAPPVFAAVADVQAKSSTGALLLLSPQGERLTQPLVAELARASRLVLLCGRYEGFDERVRLGLQPREISVGDYVCNGGEVPAMVIIEAVSRLIPGVLGHENSANEDSHSTPGWLEYPQYTRPPEFAGLTVPDVLLSGNHLMIARWRAEQAKLRSEERQRKG